MVYLLVLVQVMSSWYYYLDNVNVNKFTDEHVFVSLEYVPKRQQEHDTLIIIDHLGSLQQQLNKQFEINW